MKTSLSRLFICLAALTVAESSAVAAGRNLSALAPSNSVVVADFKWSVVRQDNLLKKMIRTDELESALSRLGLRGEQITDLTAFADIESLNNPNVGIILRGPYNTQSLINRLKSQSRPEVTERGYAIYSTDGGSSWLAPLKSGALVIGTKRAVENVIKAEVSPRNRISSNLLLSRLLASLGNGGQPISIALALPQGYQQAGDVAAKIASALLNFGGLRPLGFLLDKVGLARGLACSIARRGGSFPVQLRAVMKDETSAGFISGALNLLKGAAVMLPQTRSSERDREIMESLEGLSVSSQGAMLTINFTMRERDLAR